MEKSENVRKGDMVELSRGGQVIVGVVEDDGFFYENEQEFKVEYNPKCSIIPDVPKSRLRKLDTPEKQKEAVERERRQSILQIALDLKTTQEKAAWALSKTEGGNGEIPKQNTCIFVVVGVYGGNGPHRPYNTVVSTDYVMDEVQLGKKLKEMYPDGFANIPKESRELPNTSHGGLQCYYCYELTPEAAKLIDWEVQKI